MPSTAFWSSRPPENPDDSEQHEPDHRSDCHRDRLDVGSELTHHAGGLNQMFLLEYLDFVGIPIDDLGGEQDP